MLFEDKIKNFILNKENINSALDYFTGEYALFYLLLASFISSYSKLTSASLYVIFILSYILSIRHNLKTNNILKNKNNNDKCLLNSYTNYCISLGFSICIVIITVLLKIKYSISPKIFSILKFLIFVLINF